MAIHPWWSGFGQAIQTLEELTPAAAQEIASALAAGMLPAATLVELRQRAEPGYAAVRFDVAVERPQDLAHPIRATEPIAILFPFAGGQPRVLALRDDFPDTPHQNWTPPDAPCSLCIDDRPWAEAKLTSTPADLVRRVQLWLAKAARGELHDPAQPPDPLFFVSELALVVPASALADSIAPVELLGYMRPDNPNLILTQSVPDSGRRDSGGLGFVVLNFRTAPQAMSRLRHAPITLTTLADEMHKCGIDIISEIKTRLKAWAGLKDDSVRRLSSRLAIIIDFPVTTGAGRSADDLRAFVSFDTAGEIGVALGVLHKNASRVGAKEAYVVALSVGNSSQDQEIRIEPAQIHLSFHRELAASVAGHSAPDRRKVVLVGAGALGSQVAVNLAREGAFSWTVVDQDYLMPHNLARHALFAGEVGAPKAQALSCALGRLLNEPFAAIPCNVIDPGEQHREELGAKLAEAEVIIDASASVAVSRHLADLHTTPARRVSVFFNPAGTAVVLLAENADRSITLRDLEAQYHRLALTEPMLAGHLRLDQQGLRYSGSCRSLTNRIPATRAALLSALAARGIVDALKADDALLQIWNADDNGDVRIVRRPGSRVNRIALGSWSITYNDELMSGLSRLREMRLPHETGGVLLGIADMSRQSIHVAHALPQPEDSRGSIDGFERGVVGLLPAVSQAVEASLHQLRYVGEWHSHPRRSSALPSVIDIAQLFWLGAELEAEGLPGLIAIAADDGAFAFVLAGRKMDHSDRLNNQTARIG